jgi:hypothetical protein
VALLDGLFAHPEGYTDTDTARELITVYCTTIEFFRILLVSHANKTLTCLHLQELLDPEPRP